MWSGHHSQLSKKYSHILQVCQVQVKSIYSRHMTFSFCFYLIGHEFKVVTKKGSGSNISTHNDSARIRQQAKVQISTDIVQSSKGVLGPYLLLKSFKK